MKHIQILRNFFQVWCPASQFITFIDAGHQKKNLKYYEPCIFLNQIRNIFTKYKGYQLQ